MSNSKHFNLKNIICSFILCLGVLLSAVTFQNLTGGSKEVHAAVKNNIVKDVSADLLKSYYNFQTTSNSKPASVNGWTEMTDSSLNSNNMIKGIVDVENETTFNVSTYKTTKPSMPRDKHEDNSYFKNLMINSYNGPGRLGYKSNSITLEKNSFYSISVKLYTHRTEKSDTIEETDPNASIYLTGLTEDEDYEKSLKFENINTNTAWEEYTFYIDTDASANVNIELWLGSKTTSVQGAVFFNYVKIIRYSEDYYRENIATKKNIEEDTQENKYNFIGLSKETIQPVDNSSFETTTPFQWKKIAQSTTSTDNQRCEIVDVNNFTYTNGDTKIKSPASNCSENNHYALFMYNRKSGYQAIESSKIEIEQFGYYRITFYAKSDCDEGNGATVYLVDNTEENPISKVSLSLAKTVTKDSNTFRNDWTQYSFYVYGDDVENKEVTIQIWMGTNESKTTGYVFIDDFRMEKIDYSTYSSNSSSTNATAMNFNNDSDIFVVTNSNFNKTKNQDNALTFPLIPSDWEREGADLDNDSVLSGIINTGKEHFENNLTSYTHNAVSPTRPTALPYTTEENNNVLMIGSSSHANKQTYKSIELTLSASSYYKLSYYVFTSYSHEESNNTGARVRVTSSSRTIYDNFNIHYNDNQWHKHDIYIKTGLVSESAILELMFENTIGFVFFDEVMLETSSEAAYNDHYEYAEVECYHINLDIENFDNRTFGKTEEIQTPNNWTASEQDGLSINVAGIISKNHDLISEIAYAPSGNENLLYLSSLHNVNYSFTGKTNYSFAAKEYYKITINVLTQNLYVENMDEENPYIYGASIGLGKSQEIYLKGINTNGEWKQCTIYICLEEELVSPIMLSLGDTNEKVSGQVLFDNLKVEKIDNATFKQDIKTTDDKFTASFINYVEPTTDTDEEDSEWTNEFNWVIIPSLITGLAIVIAVVGFYVKKININKKPKVKTKYDRRKTLDKDVDRKEKIALRQQIIDELNAELLSIDGEIAEFEKLAQEQLDALKAKILEEKEELKKQKIEIEIKKKEAKAEREKQLKTNPELVSNKKAEAEFERFIAKLDKQEMSVQKQITLKDIKIANAQEQDKSKLAKYLERKEFIKNEIAKIEAEIEEIAREEAQMWEEYKLAKQEAKIRKAEYKAQQKQQKEAKKLTAKENKTPKENTEKDKQEIKVEVKAEESNTTPAKKSSTKTVAKKPASSAKKTPAKKVSEKTNNTTKTK